MPLLYKRTIPPKGSERETLKARLPADLAGPLTIDAKLLYRSAPPHVVAAIMKTDAYAPTITEMATARAVVAVQ